MSVRLLSIDVTDKFGNELRLTPSDSTHVFSSTKFGDRWSKPYPYHIGQLEGAVREAADKLIASQRDENGNYPTAS